MGRRWRLTVVPTGVDTRQFRPGPKPVENKPLVLFVGAMDWEPNVDAVEYFCTEIWQTYWPRCRMRTSALWAGIQMAEYGDWRAAP